MEASATNFAAVGARPGAAPGPGRGRSKLEEGGGSSSGATELLEGVRGPGGQVVRDRPRSGAPLDLQLSAAATLLMGEHRVIASAENGLLEGSARVTVPESGSVDVRIELRRR